MDFVVITLGCKVNSYEGQSMIAKLIQNGFTATDKPIRANAYIVNTCSVTLEADKKSRQAVARMLKLNKNAKVYICGCSSQNDFSKFFDKDNVQLVGGVSGKMQLVDKIIDNYKKTSPIKKDCITTLPKSYEDDFLSNQTKTRGFIKVQDGCNNYCSYCIIPYLRGNSRSRSIESIVKEAEQAALDTKEIVIAGINLSSYGKDTNSNLLELVENLKNIPVRKRFGSLECHIITEEFVKKALQSGFCNHFHLSMQSGSNTVLKRMNRHYTSEEFIKKVEIIRSISPDSGITTDIIAGFAGETDAEYAQTLETVKTIKFSDAHIFAYSERKGTKAAELAQVDKQIRNARAAELIELVSQYKKMFLDSQLNKTAEVFVEENGEDGYNTGYTQNYIKVYTTAPLKSLSQVTLTDIYKDGMIGKQ